VGLRGALVCLSGGACRWLGCVGAKRLVDGGGRCGAADVEEGKSG
jgi:hypothetical protein